MFLKQNAVFGVLALVLFLTQTASMSVQYSGPMPTGRFPDAAMTPTPGWTGPVFHLSQRYPKTLPPEEDYPWKHIDYKTHSIAYLRAVLKYGVQGNDEVDWDVRRNAVRTWYHAPWLHWGRNGREFVHGLTHERPSQPLELAPMQTTQFQNWAVGMYNAPGGYVLGKVWANANRPDPTAAHFPDGTVSIKLLFTQAPVSQVPYMINAKEWSAYIYGTLNIPTNPLAPHAITPMRLLQIDVAVRDSRAASGWIFGTFAYNGFAPGSTVWDRMIPVGAMWGNDPGVKNNTVKNFRQLKETVINDGDANLPIEHLGWGGRLNGPVDNTYSACMSCHATAQWPATSPLVPPSTVANEPVRPDSPEWMRWFRNLKPGESFDAGSRSLDFSLQLASGIQNFCEWNRTMATRGGNGDPNAGVQPICELPKAFGLDGGRRKIFSVTRAPESQK